MYEFPLLEDSHLMEPEVVAQHPLLREIASGVIEINPRINDFTHILSHRKINARFIEIKVEKFREISSGRVITTQEELHNYPLPRLITRYLEGLIF